MSFLAEQSIAIIQKYQSPNGAYVASPNFEQYRFCWLRDGSFIAYSMLLTGQYASSRLFHSWVHSAILNQTARMNHIRSLLIKREIPLPHEMLPTRYRLDGAPEEKMEEWPNFQLDGYGTWLWALAEHVRLAGEPDLLIEFQESIGITVEYLRNFWKLPNYDCWEENGDRIHTSTLSCIYGGLKAVNHYLNDPATAVALQQLRKYLDQNCIREDRLIKYVGTINIDASLLWAVTPFQVFSPDDPVVVNTVKEIERKLFHKGGVHRYPEDTYYGGGEWPLLSCWLGWYYSLAGRKEEAKAIRSWVEDRATVEGELPEQVLDHVNDQSYVQKWIDLWGTVAQPLLWSQAMYLVLNHQLERR